MNNLIRREAFNDPFFGAFLSLDQLMGNLRPGEVKSGYEQVIEEDDRTLLRLDVPGIAREDLQIDLQGSTLKLSGTRNDRHNGHYAAFARIERSWTVPAGVTAEDISANLENGVLEISIAKPAIQKVEIEVGETLQIEAAEDKKAKAAKS